MSADWPETRLGDFVQIKHGWPFKSGFFNEELTGRPIVVNIGNFRYTGGFRFESTTVKEYRDDYPREYELNAGDILLAMTCQTAGGEILGIPGRVPNDGRVYLHNQRLGKIVLTDRSKVSADYLYWVFHSSAFNRHLFGSASGTKILHTSPGRIESFRFRLPGVIEQRAIAAVLDAFDDKIDLNRRMNATLEAMARTLFQAWFVDFDPVRVKAGKAHSFPMMPAAAFDALPRRFVESGMGQIPEGWRPGVFADIARNARRTVDPGQQKPDMPYIGLEHMPRHSIALSNWGTADGLQSGKFRFQRGEVLFGKLRPYFHKIGVAPIEGVCSTDILVIQPQEPNWFGLVLGHSSSDDFVRYADARSSGTKMPRTNWQDMARYPVTLPPIGIAEAFTKAIRPMIDTIVANIHQSRTLAEIRDTLLPNLMSGEVRVQP